MSTLLQSDALSIPGGSQSANLSFGSNVTAGSLLSVVLQLSSITMTGLTVVDTQGNTYQRALADKVGSNPPVTTSSHWWTVASTSGACQAQLAWTGATGGGLVISEWDVDGTGDIGVIDADSFEETSNVTAHNSAPAPGLSADADQVMISGGIVGGTGIFAAAGSGWTLLETAGRAGAQYRLPTGTVTDNQGPWTSDLTRPATSFMVVFGRTAAPEPEVFQYPPVRTRGLNHRLN